MTKTILILLSGATVTNDTLVLAFATSVTDAQQLFKVEIGAGAVKDLAGNKNTAGTTYVDNRAVATALELTAIAATGHADGITTGKIGVDNADKNVITVNFGANKMTDSAITAGNYTLDGGALPATSQVYFDQKSDGTTDTIVKIVLPKETYTVASIGTLTLSKSIVNVDGTKYVAVAATDAQVNVPVQLSDNTKPILTGAKYVAAEGDTTTNTFQLTFSEGLAAITADTADNMNDFVVIIGGAEYAVTHLSTVTDGDTKVTVQIATAVNVAQAVDVQVVPVGAKNAAIATKDTAKLADGTTGDGNLLTESTKVAVSGTVAP